MRIGIDTGGTFTDFVCIRSGRAFAWKVPSTPADPARAVEAGLLGAPRPPRSGDSLLLGTTVATNALLENRLARVVFVTNEGLEDLLEIGRQARPRLFALEPEPAPPLVPRALRLGIAERQDALGRPVRRAGPDEWERLRRRIARRAPEALAVGLVHSYADPSRERAVARALSVLGLPITLSSDLAPVEGEFERFQTAAANAGLVPIVGPALRRIERLVRPARMRVFLSQGGTCEVSTAASRPIRLVLSGPAGGALAAARLARRLGCPAAAALDVGGTSTDVTILQGAPARTDRLEAGGRTVLVPSLDVRTIGAGGGSIAWVDTGGLLRVGPRSAGAVPGPACYGKAEEPTVTDAHLVLGRLPSRIAGERELDLDRARRAVERLGRRLGLSVRRTAEGILRVAESQMARAVRAAAVAHGLDPTSLPLIAFGGCGPLHACRLADALGLDRAFVAPWPGNFSALGLLLARPEREGRRTIRLADPDRRRARLFAHLERLEKEVVRDLLEGRRAGRAPVVQRTLFLRYVGQSFALPLRAPGPAGRSSIRTAFDRLHAQVFGHCFPERAVEVLDIHVRAALGRSAPWPRFPPQDEGPDAPAPLRGGPLFVRRGELVEGGAVAGPASIVEEGATTFVERGWTASHHPSGALLLRRVGA